MWRGGYVGDNIARGEKLWLELPYKYPLGSWWRTSMLGICQVAGYHRDMGLGPLVGVVPTGGGKPHAVIPGALVERIRG